MELTQCGRLLKSVLRQLLHFSKQAKNGEARFEERRTQNYVNNY